MSIEFFTPVTRSKILIVDDLPENLLAMGKILEKLNADIVTTTSGNEALALVLQQDFALILLDVQMPDMDGFEIAELLRAEKSTRHIPIIFLTATKFSDQRILQGYQAGAVDYLYKPVNIDVLTSKVKIFLLLYEQQNELRVVGRNYQLLVEGVPDIIYSFSEQRGSLYCSPQVASILGFSPQQLAENPRLWTEAIHPEDLPRVLRAIKAFPKGKPFDLEYRIIGAQGKWLWLRDRSIAGRINGDEYIIDGIATDITARKNFEELLIQQARFDPLTGLANRNALVEFQQQAINRAIRYGRKIAVLLLDLDHFKDINDHFGHDIGDELLKSVARRLLDIVRRSDLVARIGGDEFIVILDQITSPENVRNVAQKIIDSLGVPHLLGGHKLIAGTSIGIYLFNPEDQATAQEINKCADLAMYCAKREGRNRYCFFSAEMQPESVARIRNFHGLDGVISNKELYLLYQPQIDLKAKRIYGFEALLRWNHKEFGGAGPGCFISLAEERGLILAIGVWVLRDALWGPPLLQSMELSTGINLSVNVSPRQLRQKNFTETIKELLNGEGLSPSQLVLQLTEGAIMENPEAVRDTLLQIRKFGVRIAIDDFGIGFSSLNYLANLPIDIIKIDLSFVQCIGKNKNGEAVIMAILTLAQNLGLEVIAEGVETSAQVKFLAEHGCNIMQGDYFSKPVDKLTAYHMLGSDFDISRME